VLEHVQLRVERLAAVEIPAVLPAPEKRAPAGHVFDVADIDAAATEHVELGFAEVLADRPDYPHDVEERGGEGEMHGSPAEHPLALPERGLNGVKRDRSDNGDGHRACEG
jgi:hypothetical protein